MINRNRNRDVKSSHGFSIVEVAFVLMIIGILSTITIVAYQSIQKQSRDAKRNSDITILQSELEKFYDKNGEYPPGCPASSCTHSLFTGNASSATITSTTTTPAMKSIMSGIPNEFGDPKYTGEPPMGLASSTATKYFYFGGTVNYSGATNSTALNTPSPVCGITSSLAAGQVGSYVVGVYNEETSKWILKSGRNGKAMTVTSGTTANGCVITK